MFKRDKERAKESFNDYISLFIKDIRKDFMESLYIITDNQQKLALLRLDPREYYDSYLIGYERLKNDMTEDEYEFFSYNAMLAYKHKIFEMMNEAN